ncbi:glutamine amidotransferase-related protein [Vibrio sp. RC27]
MKIGIIVTGLVSPALKAGNGEYADMIMATLSPHGDFDYAIYSALERMLPDDIDQCEGYIITGSVHDSYADELWINELASWIRRCDQQGKPLVGICFGHQIINIALGGVVEKSTKGWGIGMSVNKVLQTKTWMKPKKTSINVLVSHQDQIIESPNDMVHIASSDFCPHYMLAKDDHILTIQGHPEFSVDFVRRIVELKHGTIDEARYLEALKSLKLSPDSSTIMQWIAQFFLDKSV